MNLCKMGFLSKLTGAVVDLALTPVTVVKDIVTTAVSEETPEATERQVQSSCEKVADALDELTDGNIL